MSLVHPIVPLGATPPTSLPEAFGDINAALRHLDALDVLRIDVSTVPSGTILPRIPQALVLEGTSPTTPYAVRLPSVGQANQLLIVSNRSNVRSVLQGPDMGFGPIGLGGGVDPGRVGLLSLSGSGVAAFDLGTTQAAKANTVHTHSIAQITDFKPVRRALYRANAPTTLANADWRAIAYAQAVGTDEIGLAWSEANRTFRLPAGFTKMRVSVSFSVTATFAFTTSLALTRNAPLVDAFGSSWSGMILSEMPAAFTFFGGLASGWIDATEADAFRFVARPNGNPGATTSNNHGASWIQVEAF